MRLPTYFRSVAQVSFGVVLCSVLVPIAIVTVSNDRAEAGTISVETTSEILDYEPNADELNDLAFIAAEEGITLNEAIEAYGWQPAFVQWVDEVRGDHPEDFTGARILEGATPSVVIGFEGDVPGPIAASSVLEGMDVDMIDDIGVSEIDLLDQLEDVHVAMFQGGFDSTVTSFDFTTGDIEVDTELPEELMLVGDDPRDLLPPEAREANVQVRFHSSVETSDDATVYGGARLEINNKNGLECTTAFRVRGPVNGNLVAGFVTAGHCDNNLTHENTDGAAEYATTFRAEHDREKFGDFQWYTTSEAESAWFYFDEGERRVLEGIANPVEGMQLCRYGHKTGRECDKVYRHTQAKGEMLHLTAMHNREADGGDSGGPWYSGRLAYGVHQGKMTIWLKARDVFSKVSRVDDGLPDVHIYVQP